MKKADVKATASNRARVFISGEGFEVQPLLLADLMLAALGPLLDRAAPRSTGLCFNKLPGLSSHLSAAAKLQLPLNATERHGPH